MRDIVVSFALSLRCFWTPGTFTTFSIVPDLHMVFIITKRGTTASRRASCRTEHNSHDVRYTYVEGMSDALDLKRYTLIFSKLSEKVRAYIYTFFCSAGGSTLLYV